MGVISSLKLDENFSSNAFSAALAILPNITKPFSVAECGLDDADYDTLKAWLALNPYTNHINYAFFVNSKRLDPKRIYTDESVIGFLLHLLYAEHTRRFGRENSYWPEIAKLSWHRDSTGWFQADGNPTAAHRKVLASAAETFDLRLSRDEEGSTWFMTGKLQVGFTAKGISESLQDWLVSSHSMTKPLKMLLGLSSDSNLRSESFVRLFRYLSDFRKKLVSENVLDNELKNSPWILPQLMSEIKRAACASSLISGTGDNFNYLPEFMKPLTLVVIDGRVYFCTSIKDLGDLRLSSSAHIISTKDGRYLANVSLDQNNRFITYPDFLDISFGDASQVLTFEIKKKDSLHSILSQDLLGWDPADWVQVFTMQGQRFSLDSQISSRSVQSGIQLIIPSNCILKGEFVRRLNIDQNWVLFSEVTQGLDGKIAVEYDGEIIWDLASASSTTSPIDDLYIYTLPVSDSSSEIPCAVKVSLKTGFKLNGVRLGHRKLQIGSDGEIQEACIGQEDIMNPVLVTLNIRHIVSGMTGIVRRKIDVKPRSFVWLKLGHPEGKPLSALYVGGETTPDLRVNSNNAEDTLFLFEGNRFICVCSSKSFKPTGLRGLGEPLTVWSGLFNVTQEKFTIAKRCLNQGIIFKCQYLSGDTGLKLDVQLSSPSINVTEVKWLAYTTGPKSINLECTWVPGKFGLTLKSSEGVALNDLLCVVALFQDAIVGVWHNRTNGVKSYQLFLVAENAAKENPISGSNYASLIRATMAPILCEYSMPVVRSWLKHSSIDSLIRLIEPHAPSELLPFKSDLSLESRWLDAVGRCYDGDHRRPCRSISDQEAKQIWETLLPNFDSTRASDSLAGFLMIRRMASISPLFAKDVVSRYFILPVTGVDYSQWKVHLNNTLKLSDEDFSNIEKIAGSPIDMNFLYRNLNPASPDDVLVARNLVVLFGLAERMPYNVAKQYYFSKIL